MTKWMLAASAAALAMTPALAEKGGNGHGNGGGHGASPSAMAHGGGHADRQMSRGGGELRPERQSPRFANSGFERGHGNDHARAERVARESKPASFAVDHGRGHGPDIVRNERTDTIRIADRIKGRNEESVASFAPRWDNNGLARFDGCPPGLAQKGNGCLPPGQAKKIVGTTLPSTLAASVLGGPYRDWYRDDDRYFYRSDADYIYRVNRDGGLIDALFPITDRNYYYYPVGDNYPSSYNYYNVPYQYRSYYPDSSDMWYRYGDGAIYSVNPSTGLISGIAALLAGDLSVGQPLPQSYSVYNVPLSYRDRYYDTLDAWYRYNDGYIYRVDPTTQLITAVINAIV